MKLYKRLMAKYAPSADANNGLYFYGVAKAYDIVRVIQKAGKNPTRAALLKAARNMDWVNPFALKGVRVKTKGGDQYALSQMKLVRFQDGVWTEFGSLIQGR